MSRASRTLPVKRVLNGAVAVEGLADGALVAMAAKPPLLGAELVGFSALLSVGKTSGVWIKIMPAGRFQGRDGRGPFDAGDKTAMQAIIDRSVAHYAGCDLMLDYDHQSLFSAGPGKGGTAPASGWFKQFEARDDGIYGQVEWTAAAAEKIKSQEYRYISPLFTTDKATGKVLRIENAALVNQPNLSLDAIAAAKEWSENKEVPPMNEFLAKLAKELGLTDTASEDAILQAVADLKANKIDPAEHVPMATFVAVVAEANALRQGITEEAAEAFVNGAIQRGDLTPMMKSWAIDLAKVNQPKLVAFMEHVGPATRQILETQFKGGGRPLPSSLDGEEAQIAARLGLSNQQFVAARDPNGNR